MAFSVEIPVPVSANALFFNVPGKGRAKTKAYENWQQTAAMLIVAGVRADRRIAGSVAVTIDLPATCGLDIDNAAKPVLDALVYSRRIDDDRHVAELHVRRTRLSDTALVTVEQFEQAQAAA